MKSTIFSHNCQSESKSLITDKIAGEILCSECGQVVEEKIRVSQDCVDLPKKKSGFLKQRSG